MVGYWPRLSKLDISIFGGLMDLLTVDYKQNILPNHLEKENLLGTCSWFLTSVLLDVILCLDRVVT